VWATRYTLHARYLQAVTSLSGNDKHLDD